MSNGHGDKLRERAERAEAKLASIDQPVTDDEHEAVLVKLKRAEAEVKKWRIKWEETDNDRNFTLGALDTECKARKRAEAESDAMRECVEVLRDHNSAKYHGSVIYHGDWFRRKDQPLAKLDEAQKRGE